MLISFKSILKNSILILFYLKISVKLDEIDLCFFNNEPSATLAAMVQHKYRSLAFVIGLGLELAALQLRTK